ncbi:ankyrin repeat domain-containing protein [Paenibacillus sp. SC116]|uniref:ankyrin repeat domain-containing protein n=1 Tax=Paenibacillus sp. SC116 TaxID=2968986 RepID=UPI00215AA1CF|nr:ankyrin repeat domain-containing protein [Paenibacillus sp. SC116]MCR8843311.1 ankyrin repeat domain-containing protein [Paenibacillus sp. SC116]
MSKVITDETLHAACYNQNIDLVKQLLTKIKPNMLNKKLSDYSNPIQGTPLQITCRNGNLDIVKLLIEAGADKEIKDVGRQSPLSISVANNHYDVSNYLIEAGADVQSKGPNNLKPIHYACAYGNKKIIELLLSKGIDINQVDGQKSSLLDFTTNLEGGNFEATKTLVENGIDKQFFSTAFKWACWRNNLSIAQYLVENGANYKTETTPKSELLFWICGLGHKDIVKLLLDLGVDFKTHVKFKGKMLSYNGSPLDRAMETNQMEIVELIHSY